jgi:transcriptional regulator with XRE-family HTH domain
MENLGIKLKEIRKSKNYTRKYVAEKLREKGFDISDKTLYGYENGRTTANADLFMALCEIYEITDVLTMFGYTGFREDGNIILNSTEVELITKFRELDKIGKTVIVDDVDRELRYNRLRAYAEQFKDLDGFKKGELNEREHNEEKD